MNKSELFTFIMGMADRANEMMVLDRKFDYQLGIDFSAFLNHTLNSCNAAGVVNQCIKSV